MTLWGWHTLWGSGTVRLNDKMSYTDNVRFTDTVSLIDTVRLTDTWGWLTPWACEDGRHTYSRLVSRTEAVDWMHLVSRTQGRDFLYHLGGCKSGMVVSEPKMTGFFAEFVLCRTQLQLIYSKRRMSDHDWTFAYDKTEWNGMLCSLRITIFNYYIELA